MKSLSRRFEVISSPSAFPCEIKASVIPLSAKISLIFPTEITLSPLAFILSGNTVKILQSSSLPLGILDCLHPDTASYALAENDVLLFISDGVSDAFPTTADLYEVLRGIPIRNPQQLADSLLESALRAYGGTAKDDMTAVAVRLFKPLV